MRVLARTKSKISGQRQGMRAEASKERLQKVLARAGLGSRRACEQMILEGMVKVNGQTFSKLPVLVDVRKDKIMVEGQLLPRAGQGSKAQTVRPAEARIGQSS